MAMRLIGKDLKVELFDGGAQGAAGPTWGSGVEVTATAREVRFDPTMETVSVRVPTDVADAIRNNVSGYTYEIDLAVPATGPFAITIGNYAKVISVPIGALASPDLTIIGLYTGNEWEDGGDGVQTQKITIEGPAE